MAGLPSLTSRLAKCYSGAVYDVLRETGRRDCILPNTLRPLDPSLTLAGPAWTCSGRIDETVSDDDSLMSWTGLLGAAPAGSVIVCQPNDSTIAHMGELSAETLNYRGVRGYVVDGGCRDVDFILKLGFPVFCRYFTPADVVGRWTVDTMGEPVEIGGVTVSPGDYVIGDIDGVVVIPVDLANQVVTRTEEVMSTESELRTSILSGMAPQAAYRKYRLF